MRLDVMVTADVPMPRGYVFREGGNPVTRLAAGLRPGGEVLQAHCLAFAIRHPSAGTILIDTGLHPDASQSVRKDFGAPMSLLFRGLRPSDAPFDEQLRALGIEPEGVERVVMTHLHVDHTSGMRLLPRAEFTCSREEWTATRKRAAVGKGYVSRHLPPEHRMQLVDFDSDGVPHGPFSKTIDLLGDDSIRLISTPGHTAGHLSVLLAPEEGPKVMLVGDAAYTRRSINEEILPMLTDHDGRSLRSMGEIKAFAGSEPDAILVPTHDPVAWREVQSRTRAPSGRAPS